MTTISVTVLGEDPSEADRLYRGLHTELRGLDLDRADFTLDSHVPDEAKADPATITEIVVALSGSRVLLQLVRLLQDWVNRQNGRKIVIQSGERSLEITGPPVEYDDQLIKDFLSEESEET